MSQYANLPYTLTDIPNWVTWRYETRDGKPTKVPCDANRNNAYAKSNEASTWATFEQAVAAADPLSNFDGIGFMLHGTHVVGFDFDGVLQDKEAEPFVLEILRHLGNPYCEITPSGNGLRAFVEYPLALPASKRKFTTNTNGKYGAEIYSGLEGGRYLTTTGNKFSGNGVPKVPNLDLVYFMVSQITNEKLKSLWMGDVLAYDGDESRADLALAGILARLFDNDVDKIEWAFSESKLGQRDKWRRKDYRDRTIKKALENAGPKTDPARTELAGNPDKMKLNLVPLSDIEAELQEWLWQNRFPKNALTNLSGDANKGKSLVLYDVMARLSTGADMPDGSANPFGGQPKKVILMFSEGSLKTTVKPRMMVMNANMNNVLALKSVSRKGETDPDKRQFSLDQDLNLLRQALQDHPDTVLIGFDPITNYLGDKCNMNRSQDVRRVLTPLGELAEECAVSVVAIIHFSKNREMSAMHRTGGAAALVEVPRAAWCCLPDDDPEHKDGFVLVPIKNNLGKRIGGLRYDIEETFITIRGQQASEPQLRWGGPTDKTADDILSVQNDPAVKGIAKARSWLEALFKDDFARKSADVLKAAEADGITEDCFKKARAALKMEVKKLEWQWYMRRRQGDLVPWCIAPDSEGKPDTEKGENLIEVEF